MEYLYIAAALVVLFTAVLLVRTAFICAKAQKLKAEPPKPDEARSLEYAQKLAKMIQCKTISVKDSYDDAEFAKQRAAVEELFPIFTAKSEKMIFSDDCWMYRLKGKDSSRRIMLMSHHDVVAADGEWEHEPFSGAVVDGKIWGRGTVDTKTPLFAEFMALEELLADGFEPECDIYIGSSHNEELGGDGIPKALEYFKEKGIDFEVILDEGGAVIVPPIGGIKAGRCAMVAVHEKGRYYLNCAASDKSGHAGLTAGQSLNCVERMSAFIGEISGKNIFIRRLNPQMKAMFKHLAPYCKFPMNMLFSNLWCFGGILKAVMPKLSAAAGGLLGTTCTFTEIKGSSKEKQCTATAFLRPIDEDDLQKDIEAFKKVAEKYGITVEIGENSEFHKAADISKPQFKYAMDCIAKIFPQFPASPFILPAGTDARTFTDICPCVLRFAPIRLSAQQLASVHSENENLDISSITEAVEFYKLFVREYK